MARAQPCDDDSALRPLFITAVCLGLALPGTASGKARWKRVGKRDGIEVAARAGAKGHLPTFRGRGVVQGNLYDVLAVLSDIGRHQEWMDGAKEVRQVQRISEREYVVYVRSGAPWPASERDVVYRTKTTVNRPKMSVRVDFWAVKSPRVPVPPGVVRMKAFRGHYAFRALGKKRTWAEYQVVADAGGWLPKSLAETTTKWLPLRMLQGLRRQVRRTAGWYKYRKRIVRWKAGKY